MLKITFQVLHDWDMDEKRIVCPIYDGFSVMVENEGDFIGQFYPNAFFMKCFIVL